jgi:hypothetical protein
MFFAYLKVKVVLNFVYKEVLSENNLFKMEKGGVWKKLNFKHPRSRVRVSSANAGWGKVRNPARLQKKEGGIKEGE